MPSDAPNTMVGRGGGSEGGEQKEGREGEKGGGKGRRSVEVGGRKVGRQRGR